jgi:hypothetical protein
MFKINLKSTIMLKAKKVREYRSKKEDTKGEMRYSYSITSSNQEELDKFVAQQGKFLPKTTDGSILWNRTEDYGKNPEITVTQDERFVMIMDEDQVAYEKAEARPLFAQMYFNQAQERKAKRVSGTRVSATASADLANA